MNRINLTSNRFPLGGTQGDILINGTKQSIESLKPVIGFVPQEQLGKGSTSMGRFML